MWKIKLRQSLMGKTGDGVDFRAFLLLRESSPDHPMRDGSWRKTEGILDKSCGEANQKE